MAMIERLRALSPLRQIAMVLITVLVVAAAAMVLWNGFFRTSYEVIFADLKPEDASLIVTELEKQKVPFRLEADGTTLSVPEAQANETRVMILGGDLPLKGSVGFELFNNSDLGLTEFAQRINYLRALQGELARTIMSLDGIESARVHIVLPESRLFRDDQLTAKAAVTLVPKLGKGISGETVAGIQKLVAASVTGLNPDNIAILDSRGQSLTISGLAASVSTRSEIENRYAVAIENAIRASMPDTDPDVIVRVPQPAADYAGQEDQAFSPTSRTFPLDVTVRFPVPPESGTGAKITDILARDMAWDEKRGDRFKLLVAVDMPAPTSTISAPPRTSDSVAGRMIDHEGSVMAWLERWDIWIGLGLLGAVLLFLRSRGAAAMSERKSDKFAEQLHRSLQIQKTINDTAR